MKKTLCLMIASMLGASAFGNLMMQIISTHNGPAVVIDGVTYYLPSYAVTDPTTNYPAGFEAFDFVANTTNVSASAPQIAEWTRQADPGDLIAVSAESINPTNALAVFMGSDGEVYAGDIVKIDGQMLAIALPDELAAGDMYLMWLYNEHGFGLPAKINATEAWWVGHPVNDGSEFGCATGQVFSVYGQNILPGSSTTAYLYCANEDEILESVSANKYRADFIVPETWQTGTNTLYLHNGFGGAFGWADSVGIMISARVYYNDDTNTWFNVKDYGAVGDGVADDATAITTALAAANTTDWSTLYFPEGDYAVGASIHIGTKIRYIGDGPETTVVKYHPSYGYDSTHKYGIFYSNTDILFKDLKVDGDKSVITNSPPNIPAMQNRTTAGSVSYDNVWINGGLENQNCKYVYATNCTFEFSGYFALENGIYAEVVDCEFLGKNDSGFMVSMNNRKSFSMTGCTFRNYDDESTTGWFQGRCVFGGKLDNFYFSGNTTTNLQVRPGLSNQNTGEFLMWEFTPTLYEGFVSSASDNGFTCESLTNSFTTYKKAVIISGRGLGQVREISSINFSTGEVSILRPWNVVPDSSSFIQIGYYQGDAVIYNNVFDGRNSTNSTAQAVVEPFGSAFNMIIDSNHVTDVRYGIRLWPMCDDGYNASACFNLIQNNVYSNINSTHQIVYSDWGATPATVTDTAFGNVFRKNRAYGVSGQELRIGTSSDGNHTTMGLNIYDSNYSDNAASNTVYTYQGKLLMVGNEIVGAIGNAVYMNAASTNYYFANTWDGFDAGYAMVSPQLQIPQGTILLSAASTTIDLYNVGTTGLTWTASDNAVWLDVTSSGSIAAESSGTMTLSRIGSTTNGATALVSVYENGFVLETSLGGEILQNPNFDENITGWETVGGHSWSNGTDVINASKATGDYQVFTLTNGVTYRIAGESVVATIPHMLRLCKGTSPNAGVYSPSEQSSPASFVYYYTADETTSYNVYLRNGGDGTVAWTSVSVKPYSESYVEGIISTNAFTVIYGDELGTP